MSAAFILLPNENGDNFYIKYTIKGTTNGDYPFMKASSPEGDANVYFRDDEALAFAISLIQQLANRGTLTITDDNLPKLRDLVESRADIDT